MKNSVEDFFRKNIGKTLSGEYIARCLRISRAAVWKQVKKMKLKGYDITGKIHRGYCLTSSGKESDLKDFSYKGVTCYYYDKIGSTQTYAKKLALSGAPEKTLVLAQSQFSSYGRMQRRWLSPQGGLWFSLVLRPSCLPAEASTLTLVMGLSVARMLEKIAGTRFARFARRVEVKWPNDVLIGKKKICGILTEAQSEIDRIAWMVIGVGINVNNQIPPALRKNATSLIKETERPVHVSSVLRSLLKIFFSDYRRFKESGWRNFVKEYEKYSILTGKNVIVKSGNETIQGTVLGIDNAGGLIFQTIGNPALHVYSGEVVSVR